MLNWLYGVFVLPESLAPENRRPFTWARSNPIGVLTGLQSIAGFLGLKLASGVFGYYIRPDNPVHLPGAPFFCSATLVTLALLLAIRSFRKVPASAKAAET